MQPAVDGPRRWAEGFLYWHVLPRQHRVGDFRRQGRGWRYWMRRWRQGHDIRRGLRHIHMHPDECRSRPANQALWRGRETDLGHGGLHDRIGASAVPSHSRTAGAGHAIGARSCIARDRRLLGLGMTTFRAKFAVPDAQRQASTPWLRAQASRAMCWPSVWPRRPANRCGWWRGGRTSAAMRTTGMTGPACFTDPYCPHVSHTNSADVFEHLSRFTQWRPHQRRVLASVDGQRLPTPINLDTARRLHGLSLTSFELDAFFAQHAETVATVRTLEDVVVGRVGRVGTASFSAATRARSGAWTGPSSTPA